MIRTATAITAAYRILVATKTEGETPTGLEIALAAEIISRAVEKDEAEQQMARDMAAADNVVAFRRTS